MGNGEDRQEKKLTGQSSLVKGKGAIELEIRLPGAHGDMHHGDQQKVVDVDFARPDGPTEVCAWLHLAVFVLLDETLNGLSNIFSQFRFCDRTWGAPEIARGYLPAPWLISLPRETDRDGWPASLEERLVAVGQAHELACDSVPQRYACLRAIRRAHVK